MMGFTLAFQNQVNGEEGITFRSAVYWYMPECIYKDKKTKVDISQISVSPKATAYDSSLK